MSANGTFVGFCGMTSWPVWSCPPRESAERSWWSYRDRVPRCDYVGCQKEVASRSDWCLAMAWWVQACSYAEVHEHSMWKGHSPEGGWYWRTVGQPFTYIAWNSGVNPMELFHCIIKFILWNGSVRYRAFVTLEFIGSSHPVWMIQGKIDVTGPFLSRTVLKIDGNMSWRDGTGGDTRLDWSGTVWRLTWTIGGKCSERFAGRLIGRVIVAVMFGGGFGIVNPTRWMGSRLGLWIVLPLVPGFPLVGGWMVVGWVVILVVLVVGWWILMISLVFPRCWVKCSWFGCITMKIIIDW